MEDLRVRALDVVSFSDEKESLVLSALSLKCCYLKYWRSGVICIFDSNPIFCESVMADWKLCKLGKVTQVMTL